MLKEPDLDCLFCSGDGIFRAGPGRNSIGIVLCICRTNIICWNALDRMTALRLNRRLRFLLFKTRVPLPRQDRISAP